MRLRKQKLPTNRRRPVGGGSERPRAFSYYGQRPGSSTAEPSPQNRQMGREEAKAKRLPFSFILRRFGAVIALLALVLLLITSVQISMKPRVQILNQATALQLHSADEYQAAAEQIMKRTWTNTNKLTINTQAISSQLKAEFPEIADASIALPLVGQRPIIYLQLTEPQLILTNAAGQAFAVDEMGRALADASQLTTDLAGKLPTVTDESGLQLQAGQIALSSADVKFVKSVLYQLEHAHIQVGKLVLPQGTREFDVYLYKMPYFVKFNLHDGNVKQQVGAFIAVQKHLSEQGKQPRQYIDVRLLGRAYYK